VANIQLTEMAAAPLEGFVNNVGKDVTELEIALFMDYNKHNRKKISHNAYYGCSFKIPSNTYKNPKPVWLLKKNNRTLPILFPFQLESKLPVFKYLGCTLLGDKIVLYLFNIIGINCNKLQPRLADFRLLMVLCKKQFHRLYFQQCWLQTF
jgi:hypothetical protein